MVPLHLIDKSMMRQEIDQDIELGKMDDTNGDENPYRDLIHSTPSIMKKNMLRFCLVIGRFSLRMMYL